MVVMVNMLLHQRINIVLLVIACMIHLSVCPSLLRELVFVILRERRGHIGRLILLFLA